jgi:hypothetical protein
VCESKRLPHMAYMLLWSFEGAHSYSRANALSPCEREGQFARAVYPAARRADIRYNFNSTLRIFYAG